MVGCLQSCRGAVFAVASAVVGGMSEVGEHGSLDTYKSGPCASAGYNPTVSKLHELHESKEKERKNQKYKRAWDTDVPGAHGLTNVD